MVRGLHANAAPFFIQHNFELFIPCNEIPESIRNQKVRAKFFVFLTDQDEFKRLHVCESVVGNMVK